MKIDSAAVLRKKIAALERRLVDLKNLAAATTKILDGMPHAKARTSTTEKIALSIVEVENELEAARSELAEAKRQLVGEIISRVEPQKATVLIWREVEGLSFRETARRMNYCLRNIFTLHKAAVAEYERCCGQ